MLYRDMLYKIKSMRTKFVLAVGLPLMVFFCIMAFMEYHYGVGSSIGMIRSHIIASTENTAIQLDTIFIKNSQIAQSNADFLRAFPQLATDKNIEKGILQVLKATIDEPGENPEVFGLAAAIVPSSEDQDPQADSSDNSDGFIRPHLSPYVWRDVVNPDKIQETDLTFQGGIYYSLKHWRESLWYSVPFQTKSEYWSPPYIDQTPGLEDVEMVTFSTPVIIKDQLRAVCTVDIALKQIREMVGKIIPPSGFLVLVTPDGQMIYHPKYTHTKPIEQVLETPFGEHVEIRPEDLGKIHSLIKNHQSGLLEIYPQHNNNYRFWCVCQPIPSTGWSVIHISSEEDILRPVTNTFHRQSIVFLFILIITLLIISLVASMVTKPLRKIDRAAEHIIEGDFSIRVQDVHSQDEAGRLALTFNHMLQTLKDTVDLKAKESAARRTIEGDVTRAREIQNRMLPAPNSLAKHREFQIAGVNLPARFVAGDFYDYWMLDEQTMVLLIADVCGKGMPAAMFMAMSGTIIRGVTFADKSPSYSLQRMNEILNHSNDQMFVTIFYAHYNIKTGHMIYANGGHLPPVLRKSNGETIECPLPFGYPVGIIPDARFEQSELDLAPGDMLCMFTDGVSEATADQQGEKELFGAARICDFIDKEGAVTPEKLCDDLAKVADSFRQSERQDDITVLTLKRSEDV